MPGKPTNIGVCSAVVISKKFNKGPIDKIMPSVGCGLDATKPIFLKMQI